MKVIDRAPHAWYLVENEGRLFLDVACSQSAVDYSVLIELDRSERSEFEKRGHDYLNELAAAIAYSAPGAQGSQSPYAARNVDDQWGRQVSVAIMESLK
jgi:hypothetical protein